MTFRVDETTSRSQFLAHFSFTSVDDPDLGLKTRGGGRVNQDADGRKRVNYFFICKIWQDGRKIIFHTTSGLEFAVLMQ